jgi:hypothetical protein
VQVWLWRKECPHLPADRGIGCEHVSLRIHRNSHGGKVWVFSEDDADTIKAALRLKNRPGLTIRGVDEVPLIDGQPAGRKLTPGEREAVIFMLTRQAAGHKRTTSDDLITPGRTSRRAFLSKLAAQDSEFKRFVSVPGGKHMKGKGFAVENVQVQ